MYSLDFNSIVPLYQQLKDAILTQIENGELKNGQQIMPEQEMSEAYQISRITVRKALAELVDEGVLAKRQGKGTFVQDRKIVEDLSQANSFTNLCKRNCMRPGGVTLKMEVETPTARDMEELKLGSDEMIVHIERLRLADDAPIMLENLYFPGHLSGILEENLENASLYQILEDKYGLVSGDSEMQFEIVCGSSYESSLLQVKTGSPMFLVRELVFDQNGAPLHRTKSYLRGDQVKYVNRKINR